MIKKSQFFGGTSSVCSEEQSYMVGYLEKKGPFILDWKKFYGELVDGFLKLYSDNRKQSCKVVFKITHDSVVLPVMEYDGRNDNLFSITTRAQGIRKTIYFSAPDFNAQLLWIDALDKLIKNKIATRKGIKYDNDSDSNSTEAFVPDPNAPIFTKYHTSLVAKVLTTHPSLYSQLKPLKTTKGNTLDKVIQPGVDVSHLDVGCVAADEECYKLFRPFYDTILEFGYAFNSIDKSKFDMNIAHVNIPTGIDGRYVLSTRFSISRNISSLSLPPACSRAERRKVEEIVVEALQSLTHDLSGVYLPLDPHSTANTAPELKFVPDADSYMVLSGCARDWPDSRGVFYNENKSIMVFVNEQDHIKITSTEKGSNFVTIYDRLYRVLSSIESEIISRGGRFMYDERYGFLTTCPSRVGSCVTARAVLKLTKLGGDAVQLSEICNRLGVYCEHYPSSGTGAWEIVVEYRITMSEMEILQTLVNAIKRLVILEKSMEEGPGVFQAVLQQVPKIFVPPNILSSAKPEVRDVTTTYDLKSDADVPFITPHHKSLMATALTPAMYDRLRRFFTPNGYTISDAIRLGMDSASDPIGMTAGDEESWALFQELFDPICEQWHGCQPKQGIMADVEAGTVTVTGADKIDPTYVISTKIEAVRNIRGYPMSPCISREQRRTIEKVMSTALKSLESEYAGKYIPADELTSQQESVLQSRGMMYNKPPPDSSAWIIGSARDWPDARGVFTNGNWSVCVWLNGEDHLKLVIGEDTGDISEVYKKYFVFSKLLEGVMDGNDLQLQHSARYGYLTVSPMNVGTGMHMSITLRLPLLSQEDRHLLTICRHLGLEGYKITGNFDVNVVDGIEISVAREDYWRVTNTITMGISESQLVQNVLEGVLMLIDLEKKMERGADITQCLPASVLHPCFPLLTGGHISDCMRVLSKTPELYTSLYNIRTSSDATIDKVIQCGVDEPSLSVGCVAHDEECYISMKPLFESILHRRYNLNATDTAKTDLNPSHVSGGDNIDSRFLMNTRLSISRNFSGLSLPPACSRAERRKVEEIVKNALNHLSIDFRGKYRPLDKLTEDDLFSLLLDGLAFKKPSKDSLYTISGCTRDWADGRGVFFTDDRTIAILINNEDHIKIISTGKGGNISMIFHRLCIVLEAIDTEITEQSGRFMYNEHYGFLTTCPSRVGSCVTATSFLSLQTLSFDPENMKDACWRLGLTIEPWRPPLVAEPKGLWEISVLYRINLSEAEMVQTLINGVNKLIVMEKWMNQNDASAVDTLLISLPNKYIPISFDNGMNKFNGGGYTSNSRNIFFNLGKDFPHINPAINISLMARYLVPELYDRLKRSVTPNGYTISDAIRLGMDSASDPIGMTAGDEESWALFQELFDPICEQWHGCQPKQGIMADVEAGTVTVTGADKIDPTYVMSTRIEAVRNIRGYPMSPCISREQRRAVEQAVVSAFEREYTGQYYSLREINYQQELELNDMRMLFHKPAIESRSWVAGIARDWPDARGVYVNDSKDIGVWINEEDHIKVIINEHSKNMMLAYSQFEKVMITLRDTLSKGGMKFQQSSRYGNLTVCPSKVGTGMHVEVQLKLLNLGKSSHHLQIICKSLNLHCVIENSKQHGTFVIISNKVTMGVMESQIIQSVIEGVGALIAIEKKIEAGADVDDCLPQAAIETPAATVLSDDDIDRRAMLKYGVSHGLIFSGESVGKKMGKESRYKNRFVWIDSTDMSFHWSKTPSKFGKSKSVAMEEVATANGPSVQKVSSGFFGKKEVVQWSIVLSTGKTIDIQIPGDGNNTETAIQWVKVIHAAVNA
eukprot:gene5882-11879_t